MNSLMNEYLIKQEIEDYHRTQLLSSGCVIYQNNLSLFCAPNVMTPNNRVTRYMSSFISELTSHEVLDLGCGTGILSLITARNSLQVIGIDIDPAAIECSKINATINGIKNTTFLHGDGYYPVRDKKFDLIISNPPFYFADKGDDLPLAICTNTKSSLIKSLIQGIHKHLKPEGKVFFTTSSLSKNTYIENLLKEEKLRFSHQTIYKTKQESQDIYIWKVEF
ncbi:methyltransferase family protein [Leptolyngbya sp. PCC 7375]|nr:methyltransferase family protein [Leptolyngbya sp. PCC 7375]